MIYESNDCESVKWHHRLSIPVIKESNYIIHCLFFYTNNNFIK